MKNTVRYLILALLAPTTAFALTAAPQPRRAVDMAFFSGQWHEIARTDNWRQKDCEAPTYLFEPTRNPTTASFTLTCHHGSPKGKAESIKVSIKVPQDQARNKFKVSAMGGLLATEYWVIDIAPDNSWSILATSGGGYVWLLARKPDLDAATRTRILADIRAMGYDMNKIVLPKQG